MKRMIMLAAALVLAGCVAEPDPYQAERGQLRILLAERCMAALPDGPRSTTYNDWDEVTAQCSENAYWQAEGCGDDPRPCLRMIERQGEHQ